MITSALLGGTHYTLHRFPLEQKNRSLQAWDAADEYLIDYVKEHHPSAKKLLILNDDFGALACALHQFDISALSDSYVAHQAWHYNLAQNALDESNFTALSSMDKLGDYDLVIGRIPKNSGYLQHQLAQLSQTLSPNTPVILGGKTKAVHTSTINLVSRYIGPASTTLAVKKRDLLPPLCIIKRNKALFLRVGRSKALLTPCIITLMYFPAIHWILALAFSATTYRSPKSAAHCRFGLWQWRHWSTYFGSMPTSTPYFR